MHLRSYLGIREAMAAVKAVMAEADRRPGRPIATTVVDHRGDLICFAAMGEVNTALARQNALKKAYTSACMRVNVRDMEARAAAQGIGSIVNYGNPNFTGGAGGLVITQVSDGMVMGGIGVSGRSNDEDEELAVAGLAALRQAWAS